MVSEIIWKYLSHSNGYCKWRALKSSIQYGYGNQYLVTAVDLLRENGYDIQENNIEALRSLKELCKNDYEVVDVPRKKDL